VDFSELDSGEHLPPVHPGEGMGTEAERVEEVVP